MSTEDGPEVKNPQSIRGMLVASPQMHDSNFSRTVVLLCQHDDEGALGVVINRETNLSVREVVEQLDFDSMLETENQVLWGGPVEQGAGFVVFEGDVGDDVGWALENGQLAVSPSKELLEKLLRHQRHYHLCLGYAGWGPGQLEDEITTGSWLYTEADPELILLAPVSERYELALSRMGLSIAGFWMKPINE
jgi:putative transcriptional regulator